MITVVVNGVVQASPSTNENVPVLTQITIGGTFQGSLKLLRFYDGLVGSETFSRYSLCMSLSPLRLSSFLHSWVLPS